MNWVRRVVATVLTAIASAVAKLARRIAPDNSKGSNGPPAQGE